jgi:hydrogenase nickel incorporation protein HypA/HybF
VSVHELSIADALVEIACRHAAGRRILRVDVEVGHLRQVVPDALRFAFSLVAEGTPAQGARLVLDPVAPQGRCRACGMESELTAFPLRCGDCGGRDVELLRGEELLVTALELEDEIAVSNGRTGDGD